MAYLIDTYNCVHAGVAMGGVFADITVRRMCQWIMASPKSMKVTFVLDGRKKPDEPDESEFPSIDFVYSGAGVSADLVIAQTVERAQNRRKLTVVSNDRAVVLHARRNFGSAMSCEAFLTELLGNQAGQGGRRVGLPRQKTGGTASRGETEHWLKEFGMEVPPAAASPRPAEGGEADDIDMDELMGGGLK